MRFYSVYQTQCKLSCESAGGQIQSIVDRSKCLFKKQSSCLRTTEKNLGQNKKISAQQETPVGILEGPLPNERLIDHSRFVSIVDRDIVCRSRIKGWAHEPILAVDVQGHRAIIA